MLGHIGGVFVYAFIQEPSMKALFCVYRNRGICKRWCIRIYAEALSESIILRIQILGRLRGAMYTLLWRSLQRKCYFAYTEIGASARGNVYAFIKKPLAKATFCVYRYRGGGCIRFCTEILSKSIILRIQMWWCLQEVMYTLPFRSLQWKHHFAYTNIRASKYSICFYQKPIT